MNYTNNTESADILIYTNWKGRIMYRKKFNKMINFMQFFLKVQMVGKSIS